MDLIIICATILVIVVVLVVGDVINKKAALRDEVGKTIQGLDNKLTSLEREIKTLTVDTGNTLIKLEKNKTKELTEIYEMITKLSNKIEGGRGF